MSSRRLNIDIESLHRIRELSNKILSQSRSFFAAFLRELYEKTLHRTVDITKNGCTIGTIIVLILVISDNV